MPGAGKSTIGVVLAKTLGTEFIDTDLLIQKKANKLLQEIIDEEGLDRFLVLEEEVLSKLTVYDHVIATGGSAVYSELGMKHLEEVGIIVYLKLSLEEILKRVNNISTRGIAIRKGKTLEEVYDERIDLYEKYAKIIIDCNGKDMEKVISEIQGQL